MALPLLRFVAYKDYYTVMIENLMHLSVLQIKQLEAYAHERRSILDFTTRSLRIWKRIDYEHFNKTLEQSGIIADTIESKVVFQSKGDKNAPLNPVISFGKHKGMHYKELPDAYLLWLKRNYSGPHRQSIEQELRNRSL